MAVETCCRDRSLHMDLSQRAALGAALQWRLSINAMICFCGLWHRIELLWRWVGGQCREGPTGAYC
jgi:hypothetical protein